jgi:hypothetical protein
MADNAGIMASQMAIQAYAAQVAGTSVEVSPEQFVEIIRRHLDKGIIVAHGMVGVFTKSHVYVTGVQGIIFYCKTLDPLSINVDVEAKKILLFR